MNSATGHVFVVHGDLLQVACHAWLLPTDLDLHVEYYWLEAGGVPAVGISRLYRQLPADWGTRLRSIHVPGVDPSLPQPWATIIGGSSRSPAEFYLQGIRSFVRGARDRALLLGEGPCPDRERPLLALPFVGTGMGGKARKKGEMVLWLYEELVGLAREEGVDLALVLKDPQHYAAFQAWRRRSRDAWADLSPELVARARDLATRARAGHLVFFLGAGVGAGAGLPSWQGLLEGLARQVGVDWDSLQGLPPVDQARVLRSAFERRGQGYGAVQASIARSLQRSHYALAHGLLAGAPVREVVTTNYDGLFEAAWRAAGRTPAVLPWDWDAVKDDWLLKLHGCVRHPESIVLAREDYLRYAEDRGALKGIVEALLITRHLLFVGFSLSDDNFHRIADSVRRVFAARPAGDRSGSASREPRFGTCLFKDPVPPWFDDLWGGEVQAVATSDARQLEVFLDCVAFQATEAASFLSDPTFDPLLSPQEKALRALLLDLRALDLPGDSAASAAVRRFLGAFGVR